MSAPPHAHTAIPKWLRVWHTLATICWFVAIFLATLFIGLTLFVRLWLAPHIDSLRPSIESYLSTRLNAPVRISRINAVQGFHFEVEHVRILNADQQALFALERIGMNLHPLSLLQGKVDQLVIDTLDVQVLRDAHNQWHIGGIAATPNTESNALLDWIFSQTEIVIQNSKLHVQDDTQQLPSVTFTDVQLLLRNGLRRHDLRLDAKPPAAWGNSIQWIGQFKEPLLSRHSGAWHTWFGKVYAILDAPKLAAFAAYAPSNWQAYAAQLGARRELDTASRTPPQIAVWGEIEQAKLTRLDALATHLTPVAKRVHISSVQFNPLALEVQADFADAHVLGRANATWRQTEQPLGWLDAKIDFTRLELHALSSYWDRYVPASTAPAVKSYLQSALHRGRAEDVQIKLKGALRDFPFADKAMGSFSATGKFSQVDWTFDPEWPNLTNTNARFEWRNEQLTIDRIQTDFAGASLQGSVFIADVKNPILDIQANTHAPLAQLMTGGAKLPALGAEVRTTLSHIQATGMSDANIQLHLPLSDLKLAQVTGSVQFKGNHLSLREDLPPIMDVKGRVQLSDSTISIHNLAGKALGGDFKLTGNLNSLTGSGTANMDALQSLYGKASQLPLLLASAHGTVAYHVEAKPLASKGERLRITSDLTGLALDLPEPFTKSASTAWPSELRLSLANNQQPLISLGIGTVLEAQLQLVNQQWRGEVAIGTKANRFSQPPEQLSVHLVLPKLDVSAWQPFLAQPSEATPTATGAASAGAAWMPSIMSAQIQDLVVGGRHFEQVVLGASRAASNVNTWRINAYATDFNGYAEYRGRTAELYARLARLAIPDASSKAQLESLLDNQIDALPGLDVVIDEFEMTGKKLGRLEVRALNQRMSAQLSGAPQNEWRVQKLALIHPESALNATGVWSKPSKSSAEQRSRVNLQLQWDIQNAGDLLTRFGLPGTLKGGAGTIQGRIGWLGSPLALHYPSLTGQLKLAISKGQFLKIDPGAGRLLAVISLQALPKLFKLDFRDVFSDGFAFDAIEGDARIIDGVMDTQNLQMKSSLALVSLQGSAHLLKETQDLRVLVLPDVNAGGVSLLATLLNPIVGAASYVAQLIFSRPLIAAATKEYRIEGTWREPKVSTVVPVKP